MRLNGIQANYNYSLFNNVLKNSNDAGRSRTNGFSNANSTNVNFTSCQNSYPGNYFLFFGAAGMNLERFYNVNKDRMPYTVKDHIENLPGLKGETPLEAHINAFSLLADPSVQTAEDVKSLFFDESLFSDLKNADETRATKGLLYEIRYMKDALEEDGETVLKNGEDLTLYLLKKIFLEVKPLDEINNLLDEDINPVFKREDKNYLNYSTLNALGIKLPSLSYLTSLRTTDEDYSKKIGSLISKALKERGGAANRGGGTSSVSRGQRIVSEETREKQREAQINRWNRLSDAERTDLISKMQAGNTLQKALMTDAWNQCPEIRRDLSEYLIRHNMNMPENIIYGTAAYNEHQSEIMTEFWEMHHSEDESKDYSKILGKEIKKARARAELAEQNGTFEEYQKGVYEKTAEIKKEIRAFRKTVISKELRLKEAKEELFSAYKAAYSFLPDSFINFHLSDLQNLDVESIETWAVLLRGEKPDPSSMKHLSKQMSEAKKDTTSREKNAAELAMKTILYNATKDPSVYALSYNDLTCCLTFAKPVKNYPCDVVLKNKEIGEKVVRLNKRPKFDEVSSLYTYCMQDFDDDEKARKLASNIIGKLSGMLCKNKSEKDVAAFAAAVYSTHREEFVAEVKKMGNVAVFANKNNAPAECQEFYAKRIAQNAGALEDIRVTARLFALA